MSDAAGGILGFVGMSALAGVLVTAAVTPALAVTGMAANNSITMFENLPGYLEIDELAEKSTVYAMVDGRPSAMASFFDENREEVAWDYISQYLKDAAIAGEDPRFYDHGGVDIQGTVRGALKTVIGGDTQGGSSITQQYVKNVLINNGVSEATTEEEKQAAYEAATEVSAERKLKEIRYAITLEKKYSKDEILLGYLNIAHFGGRVYGVQAAAQYYFGTNARDLTLAQAASLIAIVNHPEKFRLDYPNSEANGAASVDAAGNPVPYAANKDRRDYILGEMLKEKKITQEEHDAAIAEPVTPAITEPSTGCVSAKGHAFFCDYVAWEIKNKFDDESTPDVNEGREMLQKGGLDIYTTLDLGLQNEAINALNDNVPKVAEGVDIGGTVVSVEVGTGRILAMAQNKDYSNDPAVLESGRNYTAVNYNSDIDYGGSSGFQPGSTYKVFTLAEWLKEGHALNEAVDSRRRDNWGQFTNSCEGNMSGDGWNPRNDGGEGGGYWSAVQNTVNSYNTGFVAMAKELDLCGIAKTAESLGVHRADYQPLSQFPSAVLGTNEVAPLSMATAFAGIAGNGVACTPIAIDKITNAKGEEVAPPKSECTQALTPDVAAGTAYAMQRVMSEGTGQSSAYRTEPWVPMIGKTGTTDNAEATWMSGASTKVSTVVGVFNVTGHVNLRDTYFDAGQAAQLRHQIWPRVMSYANARYGGDPFPEPKGSLLNAPQVSVPDVIGLSPEAAQQALESAGFGWRMDGEVDSSQPAGTIGAQSPSGTAGRGAIISLQVSRGNVAGVPNVVGMSADEAEATLSGAGFRVERKQQDVTDQAQDGIVLSQDPSGNAKPGDKVQIVIGRLQGGGNVELPGNGNDD
ncbi:transglycosylase domain-containing protein [Agromyces indicus]|uniref:Transglycosylase domain-containing protein n=1 Tax=Agromyces indicus TaxID=758919 RepID=A0ABU1FJY4_9MICO|nr:transglycosylase domain-containing protein [Agromyces indicus]MDR5691590.1 transglycosylase domain-containing protein [Agromyces indicus]